MGGGGDKRRGGPGRAGKGGNVNDSAKYSRHRQRDGRPRAGHCRGDHSPGAAGHAPVILRLQELEFLFNPVQGLRNSELERLACSLRGGPRDRDAGEWIKNPELEFALHSGKREDGPSPDPRLLKRLGASSSLQGRYGDSLVTAEDLARLLSSPLPHGGDNDPGDQRRKTTPSGFPFPERAGTGASLTWGRPTRLGEGGECGCGREIAVSPGAPAHPEGPGAPTPCTPGGQGLGHNIAATHLCTAQEQRLATPTTLPPTQPPGRASPGAGSAGTSLWRRPRLCSRATQFSAQFPTLIPPRKIKPGSQAEAGSEGGALATHAGALGGAHGPLGARQLLCPPVRAPALRATSRGSSGPAAPRTREAPPELGRMERRLRSNLQVSAAGAGRWGRGDSRRALLGEPLAPHPSPLFSVSASSPGFPCDAVRRRGAGGAAPPANPTQTNLTTFTADPRGSGQRPQPGTRPLQGDSGVRGPGCGGGSAASTRAEGRGMTTRWGKRLGTPCAAGSRYSPRLHKHSWPDTATPRRTVPQPRAAPRSLGGSGGLVPALTFFSLLPFPRRVLPDPSPRASPSLTTRGTTSTRWWGKAQECVVPLGLPPQRANSAGEFGVVAAGVKSPRVSGGPGWWRGWGWRNRLPRERGAQGPHPFRLFFYLQPGLRPAAAPLSAPVTLTRAPAPPSPVRAGAASAEPAEDVGPRPASANCVRRAQRGVLTRRLPRAYGSAAPDWPCLSLSLSHSPPHPPHSLPSPPSPPSPLPPNPIPPPPAANCSWRSCGTPKLANGKLRDAEIGTVDGKVGGKESGGAGLSIKVTARAGGTLERAAAEAGGLSLQKSCHLHARPSHRRDIFACGAKSRVLLKSPYFAVLGGRRAVQSFRGLAAT
ncbi:hypothetical protein Cadr_000015813 [Camelus dromedarius]|uniref:Uncharacterized protein n=1 Tax=Camelus dromedarius TaxID=9838 RepID=A0A5N4EA22_CAMDR|nr:hypothetical protein Cadr_000015813 [Camelus dromedarius]